MVKLFPKRFPRLSMRFVLALSVCLVLWAASPAVADDRPSPAADQTPTEAAPGATESPADPAPLAGSHPLSVNPLTGLVSVSAGRYKPLTRKERWNLYWQQNFLSAGSYFGPVFTALLLDQATGTPQQWGGGMEGYGRRLASRLGQAVVQGTVQAPLAAVLHEDVRYIASARHGFRHRMAHSLIFSFLTYNGSGKPTPNFANFIGYYASAGIATSWLPGEHYRTGYAVSTASEEMVLAVPINVLQEFWPEVRRKVLRR